MAENHLDKTATLPLTVSLTLNVPARCLRDMLTQCVESASSYWLACDSYTVDEDLNVTRITGCKDAEDDSTQWGDATHETMLKGFERILSGACELRADIRATVLQCCVDYDAADWDDETCDCVLQAGLLGEIVYG